MAAIDRLLSDDPALTARISNGRPSRLQVGGDRADEVADRILVVAHGNHDGNLRLDLHALRHGGTSHQRSPDKAARTVPTDLNQ